MSEKDSVWQRRELLGYKVISTQEFRDGNTFKTVVRTPWEVREPSQAARKRIIEDGMGGIFPYYITLMTDIPDDSPLPNYAEQYSQRLNDKPVAYGMTLTASEDDPYWHAEVLHTECVTVGTAGYGIVEMRDVHYVVPKL